MKPTRQLITSSLGKKYLMALTGLVLVLFVFLHMLGNLQIFIGPDSLNAYAHQLQTLPLPLKWGARLFLLFSVIVHIWMATLLTVENRKARPQNNVTEAVVQASFASRTMRWSGYILVAFIIFHLLNFTVRVVFDYSNLTYDLHGERVYDVYAMVISGYNHWYVSLFYIFSMGLLCIHLSHGVSSMFQSMGLRNRHWELRLNRMAVAFGWLVFLGFISIPLSVLASKYTGLNLLPVNEVLQQAAEITAYK